MTTTETTTARLAPDWLVQTEVGLCPCGCIGKRRKGGFVGQDDQRRVRTSLRQAMFSDDIATQPGLLQRLDPRVKVVTLLALLVTAAFVARSRCSSRCTWRRWSWPSRRRLSLRFFVKRVWLFVPIFTGIVVLPATLNVITPGTIVVPLGTWFGHPVGLTEQGSTARR